MIKNCLIESGPPCSLYIVDDKVLNECGVVGGIRIGRGNRVLEGNAHESQFLHHKSHMTLPWIEPLANSLSYNAIITGGFFMYVFVVY
jgi:hypothetical protein